MDGRVSRVYNHLAEEMLMTIRMACFQEFVTAWPKECSVRYGWQVFKSSQPPGRENAEYDMVWMAGFKSLEPPCRRHADDDMDDRFSQEFVTTWPKKRGAIWKAGFQEFVTTWPKKC